MHQRAYGLRACAHPAARLMTYTTILPASGVWLMQALAKLTGQSTVPNIFIGGQHIGGNSGTVSTTSKEIILVCAQDDFFPLGFEHSSHLFYFLDPTKRSLINPNPSGIQFPPNPKPPFVPSLQISRASTRVASWLKSSRMPRPSTASCKVNPCSLEFAARSQPGKQPTRRGDSPAVQAGLNTSPPCTGNFRFESALHLDCEGDTTHRNERRGF
jgi:hypothetical protein